MPITIEPNRALVYLDQSQYTQGYIDQATGACVISTDTLTRRWPEVLKLLESGAVVAVERADESIGTQWHLVVNDQYSSWIKRGQLRFITGGDGVEGVVNLNSEYFLYSTYISQMHGVPAMRWTDNRPYTFLFTNRKLRPHRRYLISQLHQQGLLDRALWSCLQTYSTHGHPDWNTELCHDPVPEKQLPQGYDPKEKPDWIDGVIYPRQFEHTWFSLVSETCFGYPASFRTEKIYKPILAGHPFVVCANAGFYRDLKNQGFRTFGHLIDESFDSIIDSKQRLDQLIATVKDLVNSDLRSFWDSAQEVCLYNQHRAQELHNSQQQQFAQKFLEFMHA